MSLEGRAMRFGSFVWKRNPETALEGAFGYGVPILGKTTV